MAERTRKITVNVPAELLDRARELTGLGVTETVVAGLEEIERARRRAALRQLRGRVRLELDLDETRT
jgi:hypothetical protein